MLQPDTASPPAVAARRTAARAARAHSTMPSELDLALLRDALGSACPTEHEARALLRHARRHHHLHGEQVLSRESLAERFWLVVSGQAALGIAEDGRMVQQTRIASAGEWLDATSALLGPGARYMEDAIAETPLTTWSIPADEVQRCGLKHPRLLQGLLNVLAGRVSSLLGSRLSLVQQPVEARLAEWLLAQAANESGDGHLVTLRQRKRALALQLGATPETLSRTLRHWSQEGLVSVCGYAIQVIDEAGLRQRAAMRR